MDHLRKQPLQGHLQPAMPNVRQTRDQRKAEGTQFFESVNEGSVMPPHFHKRARFGGKPAQSLLSDSGYYATLSQRHCLRSSLTGPERHSRGVEMLRTMNCGRRPPMPPIRSKSVDLAHIHPSSLRAPNWGPTGTKTQTIPMGSRTTPAGGAYQQPYVLVAGSNPAKAGSYYYRMPALHQGWQSSFEADGTCIEGAAADDRDTKDIARKTKAQINDIKAEVEQRAKDEVQRKRQSIHADKMQLDADLKGLNALESEDWRERQKAAVVERAHKQATWDGEEQERQRVKEAARQRLAADRERKQREADEKAEALRQRQQLVQEVKKAKELSKEKGAAKRKAQVDEMKELSRLAKVGEFDGKGEFDMIFD